MHITYMYNIYIYVIYTLHIHFEIYWYVHCILYISYDTHYWHITCSITFQIRGTTLKHVVWFQEVLRPCENFFRKPWRVRGFQSWTVDGKTLFFPKGKLLQRSRMEELKAHRDREGERERQQTETWSWIIVIIIIIYILYIIFIYYILYIIYYILYIIYIIYYILYIILYICGQTLQEDKCEDLCISYHIIAQHISYYTYYIIIYYIY